MSAGDQQEEEGGRPPLWRRVLSRMSIVHWILAGIFGLFLHGCVMVTAANDPYVFQIPYRLLVGWWRYVHQVLPGVEVSWEVIIPALLALVVAMTVLHIVARWVMARMEKSEGWTLKSTVAVTALLLVLSAAAIAGTSIGHQMAWLGRSKLTEDTSWSNGARMRFYGRQLVRQAYEYVSDHDGRFPPLLDQRASTVRDPFSSKPLKGFLSHPNAEPESWTYLGAAMDEQMPTHLPLIVSPRLVHPRPVGSKGMYLVADVGGDAKFVDQATYQKLMDEWREEMRKKEAKAAAK